MNAAEIRFKRLLRERDSDGAHSALTEWAASGDLSATWEAIWRAAVHSQAGRFGDALAILDRAVAAGGEQQSSALFSRAETARDAHRYELAAEDYAALLKNTSANVVERLHATARFNLAFCLAKLGRDCRDVVAQLGSGYSEWIDGRSWSRDDLLALSHQER